MAQGRAYLEVNKMINKLYSTRRFRGKRIKIYEVENSTTLTIAHFKDGCLYFSCDLPIAIVYKDKQAIMNFRNYGEISVRNKILLRKVTKFKTITEKEFDSEVFGLISMP